MNFVSVSIPYIHKIIKQEAYFLTKQRCMKILSPLAIREIYKGILLEKPKEFLSNAMPNK